MAKVTPSIFALLRDARASSDTVAAVDHLLALGYDLKRAQRAARPARDLVDGVLAALDMDDQQAAESAAIDLARGPSAYRGIGDPEARPLAFRVIRASCIRSVAENTYNNCVCLACTSAYDAGGQRVRELHDCPAWRTQDRAVRVLAIAHRDLARSDEMREYEVRDDSAMWMIVSSPSTIDDDVEASVRDGEWGDDAGAWVWSGRVRCEIDGYSETHTVEFECPDVPCTEGNTHDWQSPHSVVGGIKENPGVWGGNNAGIKIREVCAYCGTYRLTDTAKPNGIGGYFRAVAYEEADDDSLGWVGAASARKARAERDAAVAS